MCPLTAPAPKWTVSGGVLLVRLVVGAAFIMHGLPKIQNPMAWMGSMENAPPGAIQAVAAVFEFGGGILLVVGLVTRIAALALMSVMIAALAMVHIPHGDPFVAVGKSSAELASVYLVVSLAVAAIGPGVFSLDALLFDRCCVTSPSAAEEGH